MAGSQVELISANRILRISSQRLMNSKALFRAILINLMNPGL